MAAARITTALSPTTPGAATRAQCGRADADGVRHSGEQLRHDGATNPRYADATVLALVGAFAVAIRGYITEEPMVKRFCPGAA